MPKIPPIPKWFLQKLTPTGSQFTKESWKDFIETEYYSNNLKNSKTLEEFLREQELKHELTLLRKSINNYKSSWSEFIESYNIFLNSSDRNNGRGS
jgi:hypothetical protein